MDSDFECGSLLSMLMGLEPWELKWMDDFQETALCVQGMIVPLNLVHLITLHIHLIYSSTLKH